MGALACCGSADHLTPRSAIPRSPADIRTNNFDLLRLLAAIQVVVVHAMDHLRPAGVPAPSWQWFLEAFPGVPIFFAISGFLISLSYERSADIKTYTQNRALRILPGLWACFFVSVASVAILAPQVLHVGVRQLAPWLAAQLTLGQFYNPAWLRGYGVGVLNGSLWTIPVEIQFYAVLPLIYLVFGLRHRRGNTGLLALLAACWGVNRLFVHLDSANSAQLWYKLWGVSFLPYIYLFIAGILLQRNWSRVAGWFAGRWLPWLATYVVIALVLHRVGLMVGTNHPSPVSVPFLLAVVFSVAYSAPTLADRLLRRNDISYGTYIYHMPVVNAFIVLGVTGSAGAICLILGVTLLVAATSWRLVERPALRRKRQTVHTLMGH